jgi:sugar lactone lactonase YvrE
LARTLTTLVSDLAFGEAPRWREDGLYFVDMHADRIVAYRPSGALDLIATFDGPVSGLGWLPDGRLLVVSMHDRKLLRREPDGAFVEHADLSDIATWHANDMVVAANGDAFVGNFGFPLNPPGPFQLAKLARVTARGEVSVAASELFFPNGSVITPDGKTLVVAESGRRRLTAFDLGPDGLLSNRRVWAKLPEGALPDGVCLDDEGAIWVASPPSCEVLRIREGGEVVERIATEQEAIACMLGGPDRRTLFVCTAQTTNPEFCRDNHIARLLATQVEVGGAGLP